MACKICTCIFDGIKYIKLSNVYNWESLISVIDPRIVMDIRFLPDICVNCYQKMEKFASFRNLHNSEVKCDPEYTFLCNICKIIVSNGTTLTGKKWCAQRECIRTLLPNMIFENDYTLHLCQNCLSVLTEFQEFWQMFLLNMKPSATEKYLEYDIPKENCLQCYNVDESVKVMYSSMIKIKTEQFDIDTTEEDISNELEDMKQTEEKQTVDEEMLSLKFTFKTVCESIREEIHLEPDNSDCNMSSENTCCDNSIGLNEINIKEENEYVSKEETFTQLDEDNNYEEQDTKLTIVESQIKDIVNEEVNVKENISETETAKINPLCNETSMISIVPEFVIRTKECRTIQLNNCSDEDIKDSRTLKKTYDHRQNTEHKIEDPNDTDDHEDLKVCKHEPYEEDLRKNYRVRSKKPDETYKIPYLCNHCPQLFDKPQQLLQHHKKKHRSKPLKHRCPKCPFTTSRRKYLARHHYFIHKEEFLLHSCPVCNFQTKRSGHLKAHLNKHYGTVMHRCDHCDFATKWPFSLKSHITAKHDTTSKYLNCTQCEYRSKFQNELNKHLRYKHNKEEKFLKCPKCSYRSHFQAWLNKHVKYQHPDVEKIYRCHHNQCSFQSRLSTSLQKHERTVHSTETETILYKCELCDHRTKYKGNLKIHHALKHEVGGEMVRCAQCPFKTRLKSDLTKHLRYRHGNLPRLSCPQCPHTTVRRSHLREHIKRMHEVTQKWYHCEECDHRTKYEANLRQHRLVRHGNSAKTYGCSLCKHRTKYRYNLKGHYIKCHGLRDVELDESGGVKKDV